MSKFEFKTCSLEELTTPKEGYVCCLNRWWLCIDSKPAMFTNGKFSYPQCNHSEETAKLLAKRDPIFNQVIFIPTAYIKRNPCDCL